MKDSIGDLIGRYRKAYKEGSFNVAEEMARIIAKRGEPVGYLFLSEIAVLKCNYVQARTFIMEAISLQRVNSYYLQLAEIERKLRKYNDSLIALEEIKKKGRGFKWHLCAAYCYTNLLNPEKSLECFIKAKKRINKKKLPTYVGSRLRLYAGLVFLYNRLKRSNNPFLIKGSFRKELSEAVSWLYNLNEGELLEKQMPDYHASIEILNRYGFKQ